MITLTAKAHQRLGWPTCPLCQHGHPPDMRQHLIDEVEAIIGMLTMSLRVTAFHRHLEEVVLPRLRGETRPAPTVTTDFSRLREPARRILEEMLEYQTEGSPCGDFSAGSYWYAPTNRNQRRIVDRLEALGLAEFKAWVSTEDRSGEVRGYGLTPEGLRVAQLLRDRAEGHRLTGRPR